MEERKCTQCKVKKPIEEFNGNNKQCKKCYERNLEYKKVYQQKEVFCDICLCKVKQCRVSKHLNEKKKNEEEGKHKEMNEYLEDDEVRIEALQKIWKTARPYHFNRT